MEVTPELIVAVTGLAGAAFGWYRSARKDRKDEHRSDLDVVLSAYQQLLQDESSTRDRTKKELEAAMLRALDCEEREKALSDRVELLEVEIRKLGGNV